MARCFVNYCKICGISAVRVYHSVFCRIGKAKFRGGGPHKAEVHEEPLASLGGLYCCPPYRLLSDVSLLFMVDEAKWMIVELVRNTGGATWQHVKLPFAAETQASRP